MSRWLCHKGRSSKFNPQACNRHLNDRYPGQIECLTHSLWLDARIPNCIYGHLRWSSHTKIDRYLFFVSLYYWQLNSFQTARFQSEASLTNETKGFKKFTRIIQCFNGLIIILTHLLFAFGVVYPLYLEWSIAFGPMRF